MWSRFKSVKYQRPLKKNAVFLLNKAKAKSVFKYFLWEKEYRISLFLLQIHNMRNQSLHEIQFLQENVSNLIFTLKCRYCWKSYWMILHV